MDDEDLIEEIDDSIEEQPRKKIVSGSKSRKAFMNEHEKQFEKKSKSAR